MTPIRLIKAHFVPTRSYQSNPVFDLISVPPANTVTAMRVSPVLFAILLFVPQGSLAQATPGPHPPNGAPVVPGPPELQKVLQQTVQWQLSFESNSVSTGARIELHELNRQHLGDRTFVKYRVIVSGVAPKGLYALMRWGLDNSLQPVIKKLTVLPDGTAACPNTIAALCGLAKPGDPLDLNFFGTQGEALRLTLTTPEGKPLATMSTTPFPLQSKDKGCALAAILLMPNAVAVLIEGEGFTPNATVKLTGNSSGEKQELVHETDAHGYLRFVILPSTIGRDSGTITVQPTASPCHPQVTVPWGKHSYRLQ